MLNKPILFLAVGLLYYGTGCQTEAPVEEPELSNSAQLLGKALEAHGWDDVTAPGFEFTFRDHSYNYATAGERYRYTRTLVKGDTTTVDQLTNSGFTRRINEQVAIVADSMAVKYSNSINSVIYFATLPVKLMDPAVNLTDDGTTTVKGQKYRLLRIDFNEAGGGEDYDDNFLYWINDDTGRIDYLAYDYERDEGGVRFRSARNQREVAGVLFQDYVNYSAPVGTSLNDLAALWEADELAELSRIELENIASIPTTWE
ncbi:DUF6503 family protein [Neolewinella antarctica]|uniref:Uncharacterized protein n=1 Tax=Neolewinella antarctica TaxID=442734 RepID=A0ABX0X806_9BACT|nr:DUF6503 family protein [Neolewinella antarctica]NJC25131.1 hypothetical protein [Neolewinella antarctica]